MANVEKQIISIEFGVWGIQQFTKHEVAWDLRLDGGTTLKDIENFYEVAERIYKLYVKAYKKDQLYYVTLSHSVIYDDSSYRVDIWETISPQDGEYIYLKPISACTEPSKDMNLSKNIRKDLATYLTNYMV